MLKKHSLITSTCGVFVTMYLLFYAMTESSYGKNASVTNLKLMFILGLGIFILSMIGSSLIIDRQDIINPAIFGSILMSGGIVLSGLYGVIAVILCGIGAGMIVSGTAVSMYDGTEGHLMRIAVYMAGGTAGTVLGIVLGTVGFPSPILAGCGFLIIPCIVLSGGIYTYRRHGQGYGFVLFNSNAGRFVVALSVELIVFFNSFFAANNYLKYEFAKRDVLFSGFMIIVGLIVGGAIQKLSAPRQKMICLAILSLPFLYFRGVAVLHMIGMLIVSVELPLLLYSVKESMGENLRLASAVTFGCIIAGIIAGNLITGAVIYYIALPVFVIASVFVYQYIYGTSDRIITIPPEIAALIKPADDSVIDRVDEE